MVQRAKGDRFVKVLLVAADPMEFTGLLRHWRGAAPGRIAVDWNRQLDSALLVANGAGRTRAAAAVEAAFASGFDANIIVSTGFCGALDPSLGIGALIAARRVTGAGGDFDASPLPRCATGVIYTHDRVAQTAAEKACLRQSGADAVEMEAAGVAAEAQKRGLPFYCIRAVTDLAEESFANDFNAALRNDGHFDTMFLLRGTLSRPMARLPELLRLKNRCTRAAKALGDFLANCRY
jgi:adenosylhomocysteine nucleosidase